MGLGTVVARLPWAKWSPGRRAHALRSRLAFGVAWRPCIFAWFGFETYHGEQDELWYDDVAVSTERIGCGE
jgi:hypothetical protein